VSLLGAGAAVQGCSSGNPGGNAGETDRLAEVMDLQSGPDDSSWPFRPHRMRIHPLSQFVNDRQSGDLLLEARVEFLDQYDDTTKGVGQLLFDLLAADSGRDQSSPIETWTENLGDMSVNHDHYDDLTRTYLFRLQLDTEDLPEQTELRAYFRSADGRRMQAAFRLRR
jgi:hypothetical protein